MAGRPKRNSNPELAEALEHYRLKQQMSMQDLARTLGVHPSTLGRSMVSSSFSSELAGRAGQLLGGGMSNTEAVRLLREFSRALPELAQALQFVLDPVSRQE